MSHLPSSSHVSNGNGEAKSIPSKHVKQEVELDITKLHSLPSEQQALYLFNFVTNSEKHIKSLKIEVLKEEQVQLKKELLQIINLPTPPPTRPVRNAIGRCLRHIFGKGDRKLLFETITELGESLNVGKIEKEIRNKQAAVLCLGEIYRVAGDGAVNLSSFTSTAIIKLLKAATGHVALRAAIFQSLCRVVEAVQGSLDESVAREIFKQARTAASGDRGALVQIKACVCLERLVRVTDHFNNTNDFESLKTTIWKAGDSSVSAVRQASASCLAALMIKGYSAMTPLTSTPKIPKTPRFKRAKKPLPGQNLSAPDGDDSDTLRLASPTWKKNSVQLDLTLPDMLRQLSAQYIRSSTSNRGRAAVISCYSRVFQTLDPSVIEANYAIIADHFLVDILSSPLITHHRYRLLLTRRFVHKLLADVVGRSILGEAAQTVAAKLLINDYLKNYPRVLKEKSEPTKNTLTGVLDVLASLIRALGSAFSPLADSCRDALLQVLQHPSYTVQIHASYCLRLFTLACPSQLIQCASTSMDSLNRELELLNTGRLSARKCVGYANGLAAVISISSLQPLYSSLEISSRVLQQATELLKSSVNTELRISGTQVQVAWILIGGLMSLGPNFVKIHLTQLLLLWRNSLPKALTKENAGQRQMAEISYLVHVRECALGSILAFLEFNGRLLTTDVSKRIATMLQNTIEFLDHIPTTRAESEMSSRMLPSLQLPDLVQMVRRRVLQCLTRLAIRSPHASRETLSQSGIVAFAISCFAEPEGYVQGSLGTSIANSASNFDSIWNVADNSGYGVSGLMKGLHVKPLAGEQSDGVQSSWYDRSDVEYILERLLLSPTCGALEHDSVYIDTQDFNTAEDLPDPPATEVVNSAISVFAAAFPLQSPKIQESILEQLSTFLGAKILQRDPGRKAAVTVNIALALLGALKVTLSETLAIPGDLKSPPVEKYFDELLRSLVVDPDKYVRNVGCEALGRMCNGSGNAFTTAVVNNLIETIVSNREPDARAGCAMALGSIHSNVGGMAAGFHLRQIHGVLMSLCSDPHPTVHFWAIEALSEVAESAGLTFSGYIPSTLGLLAQLWISDSHCEEADAVGTSNAELELPTTGAIAHCIASLINVLGPDLQDMGKARDLILTLVRQFDADEETLVRGQALRCWEHIYLYAPSYVELSRYVQQLREGLALPGNDIRDIATDGLYNLMRRNADQTMNVAVEGFEDQIWKSLDTPYEQGGIRSIVEAWLQQTTLTQTTQWINRCQNLLTKTVTKSNGVTPGPEQTLPSAAPDVQDEEVAGFALGDGKDDDGDNNSVGQELLRWQVRAFTLECLSDILSTVARDMLAHPGSLAGLAMQQKVSDLIRIAFLASTASVIELRVRGLKLIDQVLLIFGKTPDPDFSEALLLEQYQAQISSALTPAFGADSSPELASVAISVCATFISAGLVKDVDRMGRILKLLVSTLNSFTGMPSDDREVMQLLIELVDTGSPAIGDLKGLSSNAKTMVKMSVLSAWAELQVASTEQGYLVEVVKSHTATLTPLWLSSLQEFARLRFEPDISSSMGINGRDSLDTIYAAFNRQTLLKFYQDSWLKLVEAIASLIDQDGDVVFDALDGKTGNSVSSGAASNRDDISYRNEPVAFFFMLYGISFEALVKRPDMDTQNTNDQTLEILLALKRILRPSVSGHAVYQDVVFSETMELFDRLALTEGSAVQGAIVEITRNLCLTHPSVKEGTEGDEHLSDDIEQLFELTRIIVLVIASVLPNLGEKPTTIRHQIPAEGVALLDLSLEALVDVSGIFPSVIRTDLRACIIHIFTTILGTGVCQASVVPKVLPIFRRFVQTITEDVEENPSITEQLRSCLQKLRSILANAQRRESEASLLCAKNTLMASVILLTNGSEGILPNEPLVLKLIDDLLDCLQDRGLGKVAANCIRSLLLTEPKGEVGQAIAAYLLPRLLQFLIDDAQQDPENSRGLILATIISYASTLQDEQAATLYTLVVPLVLHVASREGKDSYDDTASRLMSMASIDQGAFRSIVEKMNLEQRAFMEQIIKEGGASKSDARRDGRGKEEPSIALKLTFGA
ncbi:hypothetical protein MMC26_004903 [Xylographa opegraphella]|nr:hypothetical protein [Xylographa opegraphella]